MRKLFILMVSAALMFSCSDSDDNVTTAPQGGSISLSSEALLFDTAGEAVSTSAGVTVTSGDSWSIIGKQDWFTVSSESGNSGATVTITPEPNTSGEDREQTLIFVSGSATQELLVKQTATAFDINTKTWFIPRAARDIWAIITTEQDKTDYVIDGNWITAATVKNESPWVIFDVTENTGNATRTGTITFAKGTLYENTITVVQTGVPQLTNTGISSYAADIKGDEFEVSYTTNIPTAYAYPSVSWISYEKVSETAVDAALTKVTLKVTVARGDYYRLGNINITDGTNTFTVRVEQDDPKPALFELEDATFAENLLLLGYIREDPAGAAGKYYLSDAGYNATVLPIIINSHLIKSVEGIERFPNVATLTLTNCMIKSLDLSKNTKVTSLSIDNNPIEEIILGNGALTSLTLQYLRGGNSTDTYEYTKNLVITGSNLVNLNMSYNNNTNNNAMDQMETLDVSGCPSLENLYATRPANVLRAIYIARDQEIKNVVKNSTTVLGIR